MDNIYFAHNAQEIFQHSQQHFSEVKAKYNSNHHNKKKTFFIQNYNETN